MPRTKKKKAAKKKSAAEEGPETRALKRRKSCPDCGSKNISFDTDTEQLICHDCGLIFEELVEVGGGDSDELKLF